MCTILFSIVVLLECDYVLSWVAAIERSLCHSLHPSEIIVSIVEVSSLNTNISLVR
jgi:hypothetical protein